MQANYGGVRGKLPSEVIHGDPATVRRNKSKKKRNKRVRDGGDSDNDDDLENGHEEEEAGSENEDEDAEREDGDEEELNQSDEEDDNMVTSKFDTFIFVCISFFSSVRITRVHNLFTMGAVILLCMCCSRLWK